MAGEVTTPITGPRREQLVVAVLFLGAVLLGVAACVLPNFTEFSPATARGDFVNRIALVAGALDTLRATRALPISSDQFYPGVELPYFLFESPAFYVVSAFVSFLLRAPAYVGAGITVAAALAAGLSGVFGLARAGGAGPYLSIALGFLYATGPHLSFTLFQRLAFPEYITWEVAPLLLLAVSRALQTEAPAWPILVGALALAAPFYLHKLIAPHLELGLVLLALSGAPVTRRTLLRLALIGIIAFCFSVPSWLPVVRGLGTGMMADITIAQHPFVADSSLTTLFWPYARNSLSTHPELDEYGGRFAIQGGVGPTTGLLIGVLSMLTQPRPAIAGSLTVPLGLFVLNTLLVLGTPGLWNLLPWPMRLLQFTYRLTGMLHLLGFVLLIRSLPALARCLSPQVLSVGSLAFVVLADLSVTTYWPQPARLAIRSANIRARDTADFSGFFTVWRPPFLLGGALHADGWLVSPPVPIPVARDISRVVVRGSTLPFLFVGAAEPLRIRVYGLSLAEPGPGHGGEPPPRVLLAKASLGRPGPVVLEARTSPLLTAVTIECSRAVAPHQADPVSPDMRLLCLRVEFVGDPDRGDGFEFPRPVPTERRRRLAYGGSVIDARGLAPGHYVLPTFHYGFVKVVAAHGARVPAYNFQGRSAIRHSVHVETYRISYDLHIELLAVAMGILIFGVVAGAATLRGRCWTSPSPGTRSHC